MSVSGYQKKLLREGCRENSSVVCSKTYVYTKNLIYGDVRRYPCKNLISTLIFFKFRSDRECITSPER
jgi:hypothetical protein